MIRQLSAFVASRLSLRHYQLLTAEQFRTQLHRERLRADRTGGRFSVVTFTIAKQADRQERDFAALAAVLLRRLRATDEAGMFDQRSVGVILPDTASAGAWKLASDVKGKLADSVAPICQVYSYPLESSSSGPMNGQSRRSRQQQGSLAIDPLFAQGLPLWKRATDVVGASIAFVALLPLMAVVAAAIKAITPGPLIFKQARCGLGGKQFVIYKFRTMVADAAQKRDELLALNEVDGPVFKIKDDPRITSLGKILRKTSIDELPQLWNVIKGDMSLVGPRPPLPEEIVQYDRWQRRRLEVTPGITCIWQVSGRSEISFDDWVRADIRYICRHTFWMDVQLLLKTIPAVLIGKGAM